MDKKQGYWATGIFLLSISLGLLTLHYSIFHDLKTVAFYLLFNLAVIPVEVIFVTLVIDRTMARRERELQRNKVNMLMGLFYSEVGNGLLKAFAQADPDCGTLCDRLHPDGRWQQGQFDHAARLLQGHDYKVDADRLRVLELKSVLDGNKGLLLSLITNPALTEDERFSHLLLAVFHLQEELSQRPVQEDSGAMDPSDLDHLKFDIERAYGHLARGWAGYMSHLKTVYPYLYATACRNNPFGV